tara:strand:+ start:681 stop:917 length:237 start_codon:yes stop_codon:yes gene_type:complete
MSEDKIKKFNRDVERTIRESGTCVIACNSGPKMYRAAIIEADCYRADDSIDGFVGWWDDDDSQTTHAATPYQVYSDMP